MMTPEHWHKLEELYHAAWDLKPEERGAFLSDACLGNDELRHQIESLLAQDSGEEVLDRSTPGILLQSTVTQAVSGTRLGPYEIVAPIGAGGMGTVYRGTDTRLNRDVAIKISKERFSERFAREAHAIAALNNPHICTLYDVGPNYLVMELLEGETLTARLTRGPLSTEEILKCGDQIADALGEAHRMGVIHRDLKPSNIMLTRNGIKILDFGIAKTATDPGMTEANAVIGTPAYMAPEQVQGKATDARSDLFSLGLILYEMAAGTLPFPGTSLAGMLNAAPVNIPALSKTPPALEKLIRRSLDKDPAARPQSASEVRESLGKLERGAKLSRRAIFAGAAIVLIGAGVFASRTYLNATRARWAQNVALPEVSRLMRESRWLAATDLLREAQRYAPASAELIRLEDLVPSATVTIDTNPAGASVYIRDYTGPDDENSWQYLGVSPLTTRRLSQSSYPRGYYRLRVIKTGFETVERAMNLGDGGITRSVIELHPSGSTPPGMVWVPAGSGSFWMSVRTPDRIPGFWIDRFEVTNREFKEFVDRGGYQKREYWKEPFRRAGATLSWEQAMAAFRDSTGRPGPSTWQLGTYPDGQADFPVGGVSWYEAAAYAEFAGKSLPTAYHWLYAGDTGPFSDVLRFANFDGQGPAPVGSHRALGQFGTFDMVGNVQEWVSTARGDLRYSLGGAWNTPSYLAFGASDARPPFDRQRFFGFRCARYVSPVADSLKGEVSYIDRDRRKDTPVDDKTYKIFERLSEYDRSDLKPTLDGVEQNAYWRLENVSFQAAYNGERVSAHLYLPKNSAPPYQVVVFMGGIEILLRNATYDEASAALTFGFLLRSGRAVLVPAYKGTMERGPTPVYPGPNRWREMNLDWSMDLRRSIDYLETRPDIDMGRVAFGGVSQGAAVAPFLVALEPRIKTAVLQSGGTWEKVAPEVDSWNYAPRVKIPILMINGRADFIFPLESAQLPLLRALGTPANYKKHVLLDGGHATPVAQPDLIRAYLDWLDQYLGPVHLIAK